MKPSSHLPKTGLPICRGRLERVRDKVFLQSYHQIILPCLPSRKGRIKIISSLRDASKFFP